ncbi:glutaredoxin family protein [Parachitinimonas caeni]|uniref:Glutaredoxin family protein n=1 Tax=Parachitinimonas caeni TaxID=3031301 RepID=A0ABT7DXI2_9NEIS|nr:glutaredoxin family protein [Parachitinimonas caeni]MDK2124770.1 glutaredoxin family protein [Parachitinimonas caeni]
MKRTLVLFVLMAATTAYAGKVYQYKDANGNIIFTDQPPAANTAEHKVRTNSIETSGLSYSNKEAARKNPVVLWANACGSNCDDARNLLAKRGIPFTQRDPSSSEAEFNTFKALSGGDSVPVLQIGNSITTGFNAENWNALLNTAGYSRTADFGAPKPPPAPVAKPAASNADATKPKQ